jgi:hypothetical protein
MSRHSRCLLSSLFIFWVFLQNVGCATISSPHQIHLVDSEPRGVMVYDDYHQKIGVTPFLWEPERSSEVVLLVADETHQNDLTALTWDCDYRWWMSGVLNVPLVGQGVDLISGSAWSCPTVLKVNLKNAPLAESISTKVCRKAAVAIDGIESLKERVNLTQEVERILNESKTSGCFTIVDPITVEEYRRFYWLHARCEHFFGGEPWPQLVADAHARPK